MDLWENKVLKLSKYVLSILMVIVMVTFFSACSALDILEQQSEENTVTGAVELSDRISEDAKDGAEETTLFVKNVDEEEIRNITGNMGLFWGAPTEYTIIKAIPEENTLKVKFFLEKSNNYYVINNYLKNEEIPAENKEAQAISGVLNNVMENVVKDNMSDYEKELAIHDWLVNEIDYDDGIDPMSTENGSFGAMVTKRTMCRGYAEAMKLISECCGLQTTLIVGDAIDQSGNKVGHAWNAIKLDDKWYHLDVTYDDPVGEDNNNIHYYYFNLNDTDISKDHNWQKEFFPKCESDSYMYYKKNDLYYSDYNEFKQGVTETIQYDKPKFVEVLLDSKKISEEQLRFIFNLRSVKALSWTTHSSNPIIITISPEYY